MNRQSIVRGYMSRLRENLLEEIKDIKNLIRKIEDASVRENGDVCIKELTSDEERLFLELLTDQDGCMLVGDMYASTVDKDIIRISEIE